MCTAVKCRICGKTTWSGCGRHVDQVLRGVPQSQRCQGHDRQSAAVSATTTATQTETVQQGMFARLFGRGRDN
jgi:hypothetical protein